MDVWCVPGAFAESWTNSGMSVLMSFLFRINDNKELQGKTQMETNLLLFRLLLSQKPTEIDLATLINQRSFKDLKNTLGF